MHPDQLTPLSPLKHWGFAILGALFGAGGPLANRLEAALESGAEVSLSQPTDLMFFVLFASACVGAVAFATHHEKYNAYRLFLESAGLPGALLGAAVGFQALGA